MSATIATVGEFKLGWGESARWDDRLGRLYFVDCAAQTLHWLESGELPLHTMPLGSLPTGIALTEDERLVVALDDGLFVVDLAAETCQLLTRYPAELRGRCNDAHADRSGNLVTGSLNLNGEPGSYWWYSSTQGWRLLDSSISNANGPVVVENDGAETLIIADTPALRIYAYPYDGGGGAIGPRSTFGETVGLGGAPDGATSDSDGGIWSCIVGGGRLARFTRRGFDRAIRLPVDFPTDLAFGGPRLDTLFVTSISVAFGQIRPIARDSGRLLAIAGAGVGVPEPRFRLA